MTERERRPAPAARNSAAGRTGSEVAAVLRLQRLAGNASVTELLRGPVVVQRHSSWEHMLLGETNPDSLGRAQSSREARKHVLAREYRRIQFFQGNPAADPRSECPDYLWVQLKASRLWVTNGELNALGDYLSGPNAYDTLDRDVLVPVLQRMRYGILKSLGPVVGEMKGMADDWAPGAVGEVRALDQATAGERIGQYEGLNRYKGLLARNACHFAPMSWERWSHFHAQAREEAKAHHAAGKETVPVTSLDAGADEHRRQAILNNGYADHFLQDSFAAGHLVNKTLVMQWFVDYLSSKSWLSRPWVGAPSGAVLDAMGSAAQPGIAGQTLYGHAPSNASTAQADQTLGSRPTDTQSAQERRSREGRIAGSGVVAGGGRTRDENYLRYLEFLNSAFLQKAAGDAHDLFNRIGLTVVNGIGQRFTVGGDDTMLDKSDQDGAEVAAHAAELSRSAIDQILLTGDTRLTVDEIWALVPQFVVVRPPFGDERQVALAEWQDEVLKPLCFSIVFPDTVDQFVRDAVRITSPRMVAGGISPDQAIERAP